MYVFTNIITTLPYGYYLKAEIIADAGTTGTLTVNNGGYILNIGEVSKGINETSGAFEPGDVSLELRNIDNVFSTNVFTAAIVMIEFRLWISYDAGSTYENIFFGFIQHKGMTYGDYHSTETQNRTYRVNAFHGFQTLKDIDIDYVTYPISSGNITATLPVYVTDSNGTPYLSWGGGGMGGGYAFEFCQLREVLKNCIERIPFMNAVVGGNSYKPTIAIDTTALNIQAYNANTAANYSFADIYVHYTNSQTALHAKGLLGSYFMDFTDKASAYDAKNYQELLKRWCEWLLIYPVTTLTGTLAGGFTCTIAFLPRFRAASAMSAVAGSLGSEFTRSYYIGQWFDGLQVETINLPKHQKSRVTSSGNVLEIRNWFMTSPSFSASVDPYIFSQVSIIPYSGTAAKISDGVTTKNISAQQLFVKIDATHVRMAHKFRHDTAQSFFEVSQIGYYGVQESIYNLITNFDPNFRASYFGRDAFEIRYKTLRGTTIADVELFKKLTRSSVDYQITKISRDVSKNETSLNLVKVL